MFSGSAREAADHKLCHETRPRGGASRFSLDDYNLEIYLEAEPWG